MLRLYTLLSAVLWVLSPITICAVPAAGFIQPHVDINRLDQLRFWAGLSLFNDPWVQAPASTTDRDGLGPLFNARSCGSCHLKGGRGLLPQNGELPVSIIIKLQPIKANTPSTAYGEQIQTRGIHENLNKPAATLIGEAKAYVEYTEKTINFSDGSQTTLRKPRYYLRHLQYGPITNDYYLSVRAAPPLIGMGLLDAINLPKKHSGKFGWKAQHPTLNHQIAAALNQDLGINNAIHPGDVCTPSQRLCLQQANGRDKHHQLEIVPKLFDLLSYQSAHIQVPKGQIITPQVRREGTQLFMQTGCANCHTPNHITQGDYPHPLLAGQKIAPYTDLKLHDMGEGLADQTLDGKPVNNSLGRQWRTPPLWGLGFAQQLTHQGGFLHDGRAKTVEEAILWHGGEASASQQAYRALSRQQRTNLLHFIHSL